jgi:hypothetical protein
LVQKYRRCDAGSINLRCWELLLRELYKRCGIAGGSAGSLYDPLRGNMSII